MSSRLVTKIQDIKGIPGKHKRVLCAWAAFANNDGTSIRPKKKSVAAKAGISRWTVYRNTDDLLDVGVLVDTGERHYYPNGHWTTVYRIDLAMLQNARSLGDLLRSKIRHGQCSKTPKSYVAKGDATLSLDSSATLQNQTQSEKQTHPTLTLGSEIDSEKVSLASLATPSPADSFETEEASGLLANQEEHPKKQNLPRTVDEFWSGDDNYELGYDARELLYMIKPNLTDELVKRDVPVILECLKHVPEDMDAADLMDWTPRLRQSVKLHFAVRCRSVVGRG